MRAFDDPIMTFGSNLRKVATHKNTSATTRTVLDFLAGQINTLKHDLEPETCCESTESRTRVFDVFSNFGLFLPADPTFTKVRVT